LRLTPPFFTLLHFMFPIFWTFFSSLRSMGDSPSAHLRGKIFGLGPFRKGVDPLFFSAVSHMFTSLISLTEDRSVPLAIYVSVPLLGFFPPGPLLSSPVLFYRSSAPRSLVISLLQCSFFRLSFTTSSPSVLVPLSSFFLSRLITAYLFLRKKRLNEFLA